MRVHDACATSELFGSVKCDCSEQLRLAQQRIAQSGGVLVYTPQEGRGIGLAQKIAAYALQERDGLDTVDANRALGLPDEDRSYEMVPLILTDLGVLSVRLLTNNPFKVESLRPLLLRVGIELEDALPHWSSNVSEKCQGYLEAKVQRMGHMSRGKPAAMPSASAAVAAASCLPCEGELETSAAAMHAKHDAPSGSAQQSSRRGSERSSQILPSSLLPRSLPTLWSFPAAASPNSRL